MHQIIKCGIRKVVQHNRAMDSNKRFFRFLLMQGEILVVHSSASITLAKEGQPSPPTRRRVREFVGVQHHGVCGWLYGTRISKFGSNSGLSGLTIPSEAFGIPAGPGRVYSCFAAWLHRRRTCDFEDAAVTQPGSGTGNGQ